MTDPKIARFYVETPELKDYFMGLPEPIQSRILDSGVRIATLGELMKVADNFANN